MKHLFNHLPKLAAVAAIALSMSSCNRAEYAMLPKTTPYHATYHGATKVAPAPAVAAETVVAAETPATVLKETSAPPTVAVVVPAAPATTPVAAEKSAPVAVAAPAAAAPHKLRLTERLALNKVVKKLDKYAPKLQIKQKGETAEASKLEGKLRQGLILMLIGILLGIFTGFGTIGAIIGLIGAIIFIIGAVLVILYLLDEL